MDESTRTDLMNLKPQDFEKICRCCLSQESLLNLFELNYEDVLICDIISQLFSLQVNFEDERPKNICESCIAQVIQFYQFKKNIETTEEILSTILENKQIHLPVKEEILMDDVSEEITLEDTKFVEDFNDCKIPKTEDESLQAETPNSVTQTDEKGAKNKRRSRLTARNPKYVNKRYRQDTGPVQCSYCLEIFETASEYYTHRRRKTDKVHLRKHPCSVCGKLSTSNHMSQHMRTHQQGIYKCEMCHVRLKSRLSLERHKKIHTGEKSTAVCEVCGKAFIDRSALQAHKITHTECNYLCSVCGKDFRYKQTYIFHMKLHDEGKVQAESPKTEPKFYICQICKKEYKSKQCFQSHVLAHSGKRFTCEACGKCFSLKRTLQHHFKVHHVEMKDKLTFNCPHCPLTFKNRWNFERHLKSLSENIRPDVVLPETQHQCNVCSKFFVTKSNLTTHMEIHSETKQLCSDCGKQFNSKTALKLHSIVHSGERRFSCTYCGKKFAQPGSLRTHTFIHTGEKPYVCHICLKGFTQSSKLKIHMRTHTGERPYICPHCDKSFPTRSYLVVHIRSHVGETPYICEVCSKGFYHSSSLTKHKQTHFKESQIKGRLKMELEECEEPVMD